MKKIAAKRSTVKRGTSTLGKTTPTITKANFWDEVTPSSIANAPQAIKEAYELALSLKNDGIDPFNTGEADIDETMQLMLEKLNAFFVPPHKNISLQHNVTKNKPTPSTQSDVAPKKAQSKPAIKKASKPTAPKSAKATRTSKPAPKVNVSARKSSAKKKNNKPVVKTKVKVVKVKEPKAPVTVKKLSKELQIIKSFVAMDGKRYKTKFVEFKHADVAKFSPTAVDHKSVIIEIATKLGNAVKAIKANNLEEITLNIEPAFITKCTNLVKNAKVRVRTEFLSGADDLGCACEDKTPLNGVKKPKRK